jgi:hypothetical protein
MTNLEKLLLVYQSDNSMLPDCMQQKEPMENIRILLWIGILEKFVHFEYMCVW